MPYPDEHACRLADPDEYDEFRRENAAAEVAGREVDHVYGIEGEVNAEVQSIRYPLANGWDTDAALLDAQQHCEDSGGLEFEPAEGFTESSACLSCGDHNHAMTDPTTKQTTAEADAVVSREVKGEEREVLRVPISSTRADRENDEFDRAALERMADQIRDQQPLVFDNHGMAGGFMDAIPYDARETIGTQFDAEVETDKDGDDENADLFAFVNPDGTHPEGERMMKQVRDEAQSIKFSVGFRITGYEEKEDDQGNVVGRVFTDADLMETSRVGIPANPDASVTASAKDGGAGLPGYRMHPAFRAGVPGEQPMDVPEGHEAQYSVVKGVNGRTATDGGQPDAALRETVEDLSAAVGELRSEVAELREDDGEDACDVDADCPDGEVCLEGECVPEDEVEDNTEPEETDDATDAEEKVADLENKLDELREAVKDGPGDSETGDTTTNEATDLVEDTNDTEPGETNDKNETSYITQ